MMTTFPLSFMPHDSLVDLCNSVLYGKTTNCNNIQRKNSMNINTGKHLCNVCVMYSPIYYLAICLYIYLTIHRSNFIFVNLFIYIFPIYPAICLRDYDYFVYLPYSLQI